MSDIALLEKLNSYKEKHCYQYQKKLDTYQEDVDRLGQEFIDAVNLDEFEFRYVDSEDEKKKCREFIKRYEWLGDVTQFNTHYFQAHFRGELGCVIIMSMPNAFSKLLGEDTKYMERLISRGASASWCPKNLASKMLAWCMHWMVENTQYRLFTAYSDPTAKENGTIYQSLSFYYLGQGSGTTVRCINPYNPTKIITDRTFRARSFYKRYCKDLGIEFQKEWFTSHGINWEAIPSDIAQQLKDYSKEMYRNATKITFPSKKKYAYVLGKDKRETKALRKKFLELNKIYPYEKRGQGEGTTNKVE